MLNITPSTVRYWQEVFDFPVHRNKAFRRRFTEAQLRNLLAVSYLVNIEMYTLKGAEVKYKKWLKNEYQIPSEFLEIPDGFQLDVIDDKLEYPYKDTY
jgi:DNA-binding transcriptional MerR regulator